MTWQLFWLTTFLEGSLYYKDIKLVKQQNIDFLLCINECMLKKLVHEAILLTFFHIKLELFCYYEIGRNTLTFKKYKIYLYIFANIGCHYSCLLVLLFFLNKKVFRKNKLLLCKIKTNNSVNNSALHGLI